MISALAAFQLLQILPKFVGSLTGKEKDAQILSSILALPGMAAGVLGKSSSTGLKIGEGTKGVGPFANADEYIGGLIADKTQQNFSSMQIFPNTNSDILNKGIALEPSLFNFS